MSKPSPERRYTAPPRPPLRDIFLAWLGGSLAIGSAALIAVLVGLPLLMAPFGASAVLAFGVPDSPLAQPRNILGGHILTAAVGVIFFALFGDAWWVMALAAGTGIAAMQLTRTVHPPAGANPLLIIMGGLSWEFILAPVFTGALLLTLVALAFNRWVSRRRYPLYWLG